MLVNSILETIGNTPIVRLKKLEKKLNLKAKLYAKVESFNPGGSIKDRAALNMIINMKKDNLIDEDTTIIEATSGNTGIGLALVCAYLDLNLKIFMPSNMSVERIKLMKAYGADVILTDKSLGMSGAIRAAENYNKENSNSIIVGQFSNKYNYLAHYDFTATEIINDLGDLDVLVSGIGTGGTITGLSMRLKEHNPNLLVYGVEPLNSPFLTSGIKGPHKIQGIGAGFKPEILNLDNVNKVITVSDDYAYDASRLIASTEGILVGISSGAALSVAINLAKNDDLENKKILVILPDTGERYLSTDLF